MSLHRRRLFLSCLWLLIVLQLSVPAAASVVTGALAKGSPASYEGYTFATFAFTSAGGRVHVSSSDFDTYLLVASPDGMVRANDDSGGPQRDGRSGLLLDRASSKTFTSAVEFPAISTGKGGRWIAVVTTYQEGASGSFTLTVDGADALEEVDSSTLGEDAIAKLFRARGVVSATRERAQKLRMLKAQLSLPVFRSRLIVDVTEYLESSPGTTATEEYQEAKLKEQRLTVALTEIAALGESKDLLTQLLHAELEKNAENVADLATGAATETEKEQIYRAVLGELRELDRLWSAVTALESQLLAGKQGGESVEAQRREAADLRAAAEKAADGIAEKLVDSRFVRQLSFELREQGHERMAESLGDVYGVVAFMVADLSESSLRPRPRALTSDTTIWLPTLLPWPPPTPSTKVVLSSVETPPWNRRFRTLGDVDETIERALRRAGYSDRSYYGVPEGFAIVTPLEQTRANGRPLKGDARWSVAVSGMKAFSVEEYLRALFTAPVGFYRVLAFVTTSEAFAPTGGLARLSTVERWAREGHTHLPAAARSVPFSEDHRLTVLVYEFVKKRSSDLPFTLVPGRHDGTRHLEVSGLVASTR